jgi:hypothetical protein
MTISGLIRVVAEVKCPIFSFYVEVAIGANQTVVIVKYMIKKLESTAVRETLQKVLPMQHKQGNALEPHKKGQGVKIE